MRNVFCIDSAQFFHKNREVSMVPTQEYMLEVPKELSKSNREGTAQKLKSMALPCKTEVWKKNDRICMLLV